MSTNLTGRTGVVIDLKNVNDLAKKLDECLDELSIDTSIKWSFGEVLKQVEVLFHSKRTIPKTETKTLKLYDSSGEAGDLILKDAFGDPLTMKAIKFLYVKNSSQKLTVSVFGGANGLLIMSGVTPPVETMQLEPGGFMLWACPTAAGIVTTTNENLKLTVSAGDEDNAIIDVVAMGLV